MSAAAQLRIARLAASPAVHRAFHWLHLHQPPVRAVAAGDAAHPRPALRRGRRGPRGFSNAFASSASLIRISTRRAMSLAELPGAATAASTSRSILLSAHLDTVFPAGTARRPA